MNDDELQPIECRAAVDNPLVSKLGDVETNEILYLPQGVHAITPVSGGIGRPIKVKVGPEAAAAIETQRSKLMAKGKRPYFDFNHEDGPASFWPERFDWRSGEGVIAKGEWSRRGKSAVEGKDYRAFSPVFHVDNKRAENGALVVCKDEAGPNMGGLVNDPAFQNLPLWAKNGEQLPNAGATGDNEGKKRGNQMTTEEIDALRSKQVELETEVEALKASNAASENVSQRETELKNIQLEIENAEVKARSESLQKQVTETNKRGAEAAIKAAITRGAILPKDTKTQNELIARATSDPSFVNVIAAMQGKGDQLATRITGRTITITEEDPSAIFGALARINVEQKKARKHEGKLECSRAFSNIYSTEFTGSNAKRLLSFPIEKLEDAIMAADVTDGDLGTLAGTLVTQRTLELLKFAFPALGMFTTDFTAEQVTFNQTVMTRTVAIPDVQTYNTSTGWTSSSAETEDVPVVMDQHKGVPITFNEQIMASTVRRLFDEQAPAQAYALAKDMIDHLYTRITDANFTTDIVSTLGAFSRSTVIDAGIALDLNGVPSGLGQRTMLLWPTFFGALEKDTALIQLAAFQRPEIITNPTGGGTSLVIPVESFNVVKAPNLPTNDGNIVGFAGSKSALCIVTRMPNDYTKFAPGVSYGNVQTVTDPDLGISVMLVQYVDHTLATGNQRISLMYGTAAGQGLAGLVLKAATGSGSSRVS